MDSTDNLINVIEVSLAESTLEKLNLLLSNSDCGALNKKTVKHLQNILQRDGKVEEKVLHVNCILSCLQHFLKTDVDLEEWEEIAEKISKLCGGTYVVSDLYIKEESLTLEVLDAVSDCLELHSGSVADHMLNDMAKPLLKTASSASCSHLTRLQVLSLFSSLLMKSSRQARSQILITPTLPDYLVKLSNCLMVCGDYETQMGVVEVLARSSVFIKETEQATQLFTGRPNILQAFNSYTFINFDPECRVFLNEVNKALGDERLVFSVPCMIAIADDIRLKKPTDQLYKAFWVDWNLGPRTLSLYHMVSESWEVIVMPEDHVQQATARNSSCKGRSGDITPAIKMEITVKNSTENSQLPEMLKIYFYKTEEFAKIEEKVIRKIFGDKYQSNMTYSEEPQPSCPVTPIPKPNESWAYYTDVDKTIPDQAAAGNESESPDVIGPSPAAPAQSSSSGHIRKTYQFGKREPVGSPQDTTQHPEEQRDLENCEDKEAMYRTVPPELELNVDDKLRELLRKYVPPKMKDTEAKHQKDLEILNLTLNGKTLHSTITAELSTIMNKTFQKDSSSHTLGAENYTSTEQLLPDKKNSYKKVIEGRCVGVDSTDAKLSHESSDSYNNTRVIKKTCLYSTEDNKLKDLVLSSQEDFSVKIPDYKLKRQEQKVTPETNMGSKNISYSYNSNKEKIGKTNNVVYDTEDNLGMIELNQQSSNSEKLTKDMKENHPQLFESPPHTFKYYKNCRKSSNLLPPISQYSFPSGNNFCYPKTRPKRKKRVGVVRLTDSDSDTEYVPPVKVPAKCEARPKAKRGRGKGYVKRLPQREDPILDLELPNEMELEPLHLDQSKMVVREIELPSLLSKGSKARKNNSAINKKKSVPTKRNTRSRKNTKPVEEAIEVPEIKDITNYQPEVTDNPADIDELALEMSHSFAQDAVTNNETTQFAELCTKDMKRIIDNIHSVAQQQREMCVAAYNLKADSFFTAMSSQQRSMEALGNNLHSIKSVVDLACDMHRDASAHIQSEITLFQEATKEFKEKNVEIEKTKTSKTWSLFQGLSQHIRNLFSSFQGSSSKKALQE